MPGFLFVVWQVSGRSRSSTHSPAVERTRRHSANFHGAGYALLDIAPAHVVAVEALPMLHADPFERFLVAQALTVPLRLLTRDAIGALQRHGDHGLRCAHYELRTAP